MSLYDQARLELDGWTPYDAAQGELRDVFRRLLRERPDALTRDCNPDHLTASMLVVDADRSRVLLNLHGRYRKWMQFGGHCEAADETLAAAALREAVEESGIAELALVGTGPVQLSKHEVRCGPIRPAHHLDVRYVAEAPRDAVPAASDESIEVRWFAADALPAGLELEIVELVHIALAG